MATILPDIVEVAQSHHLDLASGSLNKREVLCKCPFCQEDQKPGKQRRYYLSLNPEKQTFKCWFCGEGGGVLRFVSLLTGTTEEQLLQQYRKRRLEHPAEGLTHRQRLLLGQAYGYVTDPDWNQMKKRDKAYYLRTLDRMWGDWQQFIEEQKREAFKEIHVGISCGKYQDSIGRIQKLEKDIGVPLVEEALLIYSCTERPAWTEQIVLQVRSLLHAIKPVKPDPPVGR